MPRICRLAIAVALSSVLLAAVAPSAVAQEPLKPFILASASEGELESTLEATREALADAGFELAGEYSPYDGAHVLVVTNDELRETAFGSEGGGFGAALRVSVTDNAGSIEVSYTNPIYLANSYRLSGNLPASTKALAEALGRASTFGSKKGLTVKKLRKYHYMFSMPYFDDQVELARHPSFERALATVEAGLAAGKGGTKAVYRVDIPGKDEVLFGVAITTGEGADATVMKIVDTGTPRQTAHLSYELLVSGRSVSMLHGKFRIAQSFPDLGMGTFMKISGAPKGIAKSLGEAATAAE